MIAWFLRWFADPFPKVMANFELVGTAEELTKLVLASMELVGKAEKLIKLAV